jgi:hypothetical protein
MDMPSHLPDDPAQCRRLLADLLRSHDVLRQQAEDERHKAEEGRRRVGELERILDQTAADYDRLKGDETACP